MGRERPAGLFFQLCLVHGVARCARGGGLFEYGLGRGPLFGGELEAGEHGPPREVRGQEAGGEGRVDGVACGADVAARDRAPDVLLGAGRAAADARGASQRGERAAGGHGDYQLLLVAQEKVEWIRAARLVGVCDLRAVGVCPAAAPGGALGGLEVFLLFGLLSELGHNDRNRRDAVALQPDAVFAFAERGADVDREGGVVDVAAGREREQLACGDLGGSGRAVRGGGVPPPAAGEGVAAEVPLVEVLEAGQARAVEERAGVGEAAEVRAAEVRGQFGQRALDAAEGELPRGALLGGERLVEVGVAAGGRRGDAEVAVACGALAALGHGQQRGVGGFYLAVDPLQAGVAAAAGGVEHVLQAALGHAGQRVHGGHHGLGLALFERPRAGLAAPRYPGQPAHSVASLSGVQGRGMNVGPGLRMAARRQSARAAARSLWPSSLRGAE